MSTPVTITLTTAGADTGPFNLYSNTDSYTTPFVSNVPKSSLVLGYSILAPTDTTIIRVQSVGDCTNYIDLEIPHALVTWEYYMDAQNGEFFIDASRNTGAVRIGSNTPGSYYSGTFPVYEGDQIDVYIGTGNCIGAPLGHNSAKATVDVKSVPYSNCVPGGSATVTATPITVTAGDIGTSILISGISECLVTC